MMTSAMTVTLSKEEWIIDAGMDRLAYVLEKLPDHPVSVAYPETASLSHIPHLLGR